ncbi:MAG: hypothetical protein IPK14_22955 [Blastocatellia bacterium]|nr:hypothetical protein [Blastocatellia bacterium]MBN8723059.1 hypothetical protein [Acidobacteriota bacterium]
MSDSAEIVYQIFCDDVRLEVGNKFSLMGIFQDIYVQQLPVGLPKMAIITQWRGKGDYSSEVRVLTPKKKLLAASPVTQFQIPEEGFANNVNFFITLQFDEVGDYTVQTLLDSTPVMERKIRVGVVPQQADAAAAAAGDDTIN